ncbi:MAG TPA: epoxide hydrolase N-terminal domain-containing protein [Nakamurella sp.]|nr:epoxide hydrolase N-terminal domain-containing protein [Nakamurella sp.]
MDAVNPFSIAIPQQDLDDLTDRLHLLPHFTTTIDGVDIHFVHVRSAHPDAIPLALTHGWRDRSWSSNR